jgi:hypothetical protein
MAVLDANTGEIQALLHDQGHLTDQRTAMAGAIAAGAILRSGSNTLGIVGAGTQARLQAKLIKRRLGLKTVLVWGRNDRHAQQRIPRSHPQCCRYGLETTLELPTGRPTVTEPEVRIGHFEPVSGTDVGFRSFP